MAFQSDQDWQLTKKTVLERSSYMFNNPFMSDIKFTCVESEEESTRKDFYAHKYVLATSSPVFYTMFYGNLAEQNSVIDLPDADEETLEAFLRFLYTDECTIDVEVALKVIYLAKKYMVPSLVERCCKVVDANVITAINSDIFLSLDQETLQDILKRETLVIIGNAELKLFQAVLKWCDHQCSVKGWEATGKNRRAVLGDAIHQLRFLAMSQKEFANNVSTTGILTDGEVVNFFQNFSGMPTSSLTRGLPRRKGCPLPCFRFSQDDLKSGWPNFGDDCSKLQFDVNKDVFFCGVRLFGDANGGEYEVTMQVNGDSEVSGTYTSEYISENNRNCYGFDVVLPKPVQVTANKTVTISTLKIEGPHSYYGDNGKSSVEVDGVTVKFSDQNKKTMTWDTEITETTCGQIYALFISRCDS